MWLFGQVWFACLVGFAVGVALDWVVRVRPLSKQVADLESRLATANRKIAGQDGDPVEGYRRSVFDRSDYSENAFVADRNRGGLLTPSDETAFLGEDSLRDLESVPPPDNAQTQVVSGVDDFPGVARLSGAWDTERTQAVPPPPVVPPPPPPVEQPWQAYQDETPSSGTLEPAPQPQAEQSYNDQEYADQQYLEFLRAGANHAPVEADEDVAAQSGGGLVYGNDYTGHEHANGEYEYDQASDYERPEVPAETAAEITGDLSEESASEVTSVLPAIQDSAEAPVETYEAYESYAQEDYQQNGYSESGYGSEPGVQYGSYQPEEFEEPLESSGPLPRRTHGEQSLRFTPFAPFEVPFDMSDSELVDVQPRGGELTPIEEGGFQPFAKPAIDESTYPEYTDGAWIGDDGQLVGSGTPPVSNGAHMLSEPDDSGGSSWFNQQGEREGAAHPESAALTQRMLPVSRPDLEHPDLLPQSVFGTETDVYYDDEGPARSLFEPVVQPEAIVDDFSFAQPAPDFAPPAPAPGPSDDFLSQATAPRPVRVRTGVDGPGTESVPAMAPVPQPEDVGGGVEASGPFGPGSALPNPDGSAPSGEFRIKARTSSMVFHTESSPFYERLEPQVWFRDAEDAQRAGFTSWERPRSW